MKFFYQHALECGDLSPLSRRATCRPVQRDKSRPQKAPTSQRTPKSALTLLEMMVSVTLLALIMLGLLAMFNQTQKALHAVSQQTDVFESSRSLAGSVGRDLAEVTLFNDTNVSSFFYNVFSSPIPNGALPSILPAPKDLIPVNFTEAFWLTRRNDTWEGIGYFVSDDPLTHTNYGVGTLYRFSTNFTIQSGTALSISNMFANVATDDTNTVYRVADGIVHFEIAAYAVRTNATQTNFIRVSPPFSVTSDDYLPAFVDLEIGVLEPQALKQFQSLADLNLAAAKDFLRSHAGQIHFFRERVPVRNFVNPYRSNEVP